jgi:hypothetical protein
MAEAFLHLYLWRTLSVQLLRLVFNSRTFKKLNQFLPEGEYPVVLLLAGNIG